MPRWQEWVAWFLIVPVLFGPALRFQPLKYLLAAFLERTKALVQDMLNRFSRCCGVAPQFGPLDHLMLAGDAFLERADLPIHLGEKVASVHRHFLPQFSSASRFTAGASGFLNLSQSGERPNCRSGRPTESRGRRRDENHKKHVFIEP